MTRSQKIAFIVLIALLAVGTFLHWFISWPSTDSRDTAFSYWALVATLVGFAATVYQLGETERSIQEGNQKPALQIEVLPPKTQPEKAGRYGRERTHQLALYPSNHDGSIIETHCALRITNTGDKAASRIYLTYDFRPKRVPGDDKREGGLKVEYDKEHKPLHVIYSDDYVPVETSIGQTLKFSGDSVIHPDPFDRPVVAELNLSMRAIDFEPDYEIHYRIQSYEGNRLLESSKNKETDKRLNQVYPISFVRADEPLPGTHVGVVRVELSTGSSISMHG